ncbi:nucleotidyltransferase family protein [Aestuariibius sp. HNIBRBA575]|uniref:nucleotidyltransferase family protein n=1 Tax=Aestuariibius sp. HNIBRBA575 TaxID=3233343 RepID=UPI0034A156D1
MTPTSALYFAAGLGTRMRPLSDNTPKPLIKVAGKTLLDHALAIGTEARVKTNVVNIHYLADQVRAHLSDAEIVFSDETSALLETGGGLKHARPLLGNDPVFTMNTDAVWTRPNPFQTLASAWDPSKMQALLLLVPVENALGYSGVGDFEHLPDGRIQRGPGQVYTGAQIINPSILDGFSDGSFSLNLVWDQLLRDRTIFGVTYTGKWCDVGQPDSIPLAETLIENS